MYPRTKGLQRKHGSRESPTSAPNLLRVENLDPATSIKEDHLKRSNKKVKNNQETT